MSAKAGRPPKGQERRTRHTVRLEPRLWEDLAREAKAEGISRADWIHRAIYEALHGDLVRHNADPSIWCLEIRRPS